MVQIEDDSSTRNLPSSRFSILPGSIYTSNNSSFWEKICKTWNSLLKEMNVTLGLQEENKKNKMKNKKDENTILLFHDLPLYHLKHILFEFLCNGSVTTKET